VLVLAIVLLGRDNPSGTPGASASPTTVPSATLAPGTVRVPDTIGMTEAEAETAAQEAGLNWRIEWVVDPARESGIYDQEPPAGRVVQSGARFVMYSYRDS
jgi:beta-lactam-binding protein with PASTA domain